MPTFKKKDKIPNRQFQNQEINGRGIQCLFLQD